VTRPYYEVLGIHPESDFQTLRKAYYHRAKTCHPDHHPNQPRKVEEFKRLVEAFNVLSDPLARAAYDQQRANATSSAPRGTYRPDMVTEPPILDTRADDILEEMIVGNIVPRNTTLQTLMLDLERTAQFMLLREAKTYFYTGQIEAARVRFEKYLAFAPLNVLAWYYRGRCDLRQGNARQAARAYAEAIRIGSRRQPPLYCYRIRQELHTLRRTQLGGWARLCSLFRTPPSAEPLPPDVAMRREVNRAIHRLAQTRPE